MGFADGFRVGWSSVESALKEREREKMRQEISAIADEKPQVINGYTPEQGQTLEDAARSGQYNVDIKYKDDGNGNQVFDRYVVTPKADPTKPADIVPSQVTDFMGKRVAGTLTDDQIANARMRRTGEVMTKYDPVAGMQMQREARLAESEAQRSRIEQERFDRDKKTWARDDERQRRNDEWEAGRRDVFANTRFGQIQQQHQQAMAQYQDALKTWESNGRQGPAPQAPQRADYTTGDSLADRAAVIDHDARYGKLDAKAFGEFTDMLTKVQSEGYEKTLRLAQSGAPLAEVAKAFNATGSTKFDVANVVSDKMTTGPNGVPSRVIQYKDAAGNVRTINTLAELDSLGKAGEVFTRHYAQRADVRAERADQRSASAETRAQDEHTYKRKQAEDKAAAAVAIYKEKNPGATPAELEAVRTSIIEPVTKPGEIKTEFKTPQMGAGGTLVQTNSRDGSSIITPIGPDNKPREPIVVPGVGKAATSNAKPANQADAHQQAQKAIDSGADPARVNARLKDMGFAELPSAKAKAKPAASAPTPAPAPAVPLAPIVPAAAVVPGMGAAQAAPAAVAPVAPAPAPAPAPRAAAQPQRMQTVSDILGAGDSSMGRVMATRAQAIEQAAEKAKQARSLYVAAAASGDARVAATYQQAYQNAMAEFDAQVGQREQAQAKRIREAVGL